MNSSQGPSLSLRLRIVLAVGCAGVAILEAPGAMGALVQALPGSSATVVVEGQVPIEISVAGLDR